MKNGNILFESQKGCDLYNAINNSSQAKDLKTKEHWLRLYKAHNIYLDNDFSKKFPQ